MQERSVDPTDVIVYDVPYEISRAIRSEREHQLDKWGKQPHGIADWLSIIAEELGEANRHAHEIGVMFPSLEIKPLDGAVQALRNELIQVATCCIAALEECPDIAVSEAHKEKQEGEG